MITMTTNQKVTSKMDQKKARNKKIILDVASDLFSEKNFDEITMKDIADKALFSRATLFNYFESKEAIYYSIGIQVFHDVINRTSLVLNQEKSAFDKLIILINLFFKGYEQNLLTREILKFFVTKNNQADITAEEILLDKKNNPRFNQNKYTKTELVMVEYVEQIWKYQEIWEGIIKFGQKDGSIKNKSSPKQLTLLIYAIIFGVINQMDLLKIPLKRAKMSSDYFKNQIIKLISFLLLETS
ncbi:MAG: TetR/AcrR family transcriptional regulator [Asgard group archaeon]|nr:TetR/AcrR family transcriptional regulator [Asgard group archaeon]